MARRALRGGLIGCGAIGKIFADAIADIDEMNLVAFCSRNGDKAEHYRATYGGEYSTTDAGRVLDDPSIDAIYITTWHDSHADLAIRAARAGKHVMIEKPLALTVEECQAIGAAVEQSGIKLMVAFKLRYYELVRKARELVPQPIAAFMQMMDNRWPADFWANDPVKGGGNVLSQGVHSCDILRYMIGADPVEVYAAGGNYYTETGVIDNLCATFRFANGSVGSWVQGDCRVPPLTSKFFLELFAQDRSLTLNDRLCTLTYNQAGSEPLIIKGTESGFFEENRVFIDCLLNDRQPPIDHVDGLLATLMVLQAFASLKSGRPEPVASLMGR